MSLLKADNIHLHRERAQPLHETITLRPVPDAIDIQSKERQSHEEEMDDPHESQGWGWGFPFLLGRLGTALVRLETVLAN